MKVITKDVHEDLQQFFTGAWGEGALQSFLYYFCGHGKKAYSTVNYVLMTNTGIRLEVDGNVVDYKFSWKYAWRFSSLNQKNPLTSSHMVSQKDRVFLRCKTFLFSMKGLYLLPIVS